MTVETLHLFKPRMGARVLPHHGHDLRRPRARVAMQCRLLWSGWKHLWDPAGGVEVGWWMWHHDSVGVGTCLWRQI
ncbi:uncharacterized protein DS421_10g299140 [Arachis hypogaea]|nr:uncharacterized protein DS421_10g299140 [Arachis hypogaea]